MTHQARYEKAAKKTGVTFIGIDKTASGGMVGLFSKDGDQFHAGFRNSSTIKGICSEIERAVAGEIIIKSGRLREVMRSER